MSFYPLHYLPSGHVLIDPDNDCDKLVNTLIKTEYSEEFCVALSFKPDFIIQLMRAGFLVMSVEVEDEKNKKRKTRIPPDPFFILLPKLHLLRSVLFFRDLHIKKSIHSFLPRYELRVNTEFDQILDSCVKIHGSNWLTPPLVEIFKRIRPATEIFSPGPRAEETIPQLFSFAVFREGKIRAGEIGVAVGRVYTSYSGYHGESNAGTVQLILMAQWLEKAGFAFLDLGMPLDYKTHLGAREVDTDTFVELFRSARETPTHP